MSDENQPFNGFEDGALKIKSKLCVKICRALIAGFKTHASYGSTDIVTFIDSTTLTDGYQVVATLTSKGSVDHVKFHLVSSDGDSGLRVRSGAYGSSDTLLTTDPTGVDDVRPVITLLNSVNVYPDNYVDLINLKKVANAYGAIKNVLIEDGIVIPTV